jgi:phenylpyruvate tautomerase PptA (4-oxalocrotonate tautomerase family)
MPVVEVHLIEGYDGSEKARLGRALTDAVRLVVPAPPEAVTVMLHDMPRSNYMRGREHRTPAPALPDPVEVIRNYLTAMEARDLPAAEAMLSPDFVMNFPDAPGIGSLEALIAWSKPRYRFVKKTFDRFEAFHNGEASVVLVTGWLHGEWPDGTPFEGIRFIDRFELQSGLITRQDVWNDMAEVKAKR